jgi:hypothetical protein
MSKLTIALVVLVACPLLLAQQTMNNDSVVKLRQAGFPEELIVSAINRSPGSYDTSAAALVILKNAGLTNPEISAMVAKASTAKMVPVAEVAPNTRTALLVPAPSAKKPRVLLRSQSHTTGWNMSRDQTMVMTKDFQELCPEVQMSVNQNLMDYTVELNHVEHGFIRENQMQVADKMGDLIAKAKGGATIKGGVKKACDAILADWAKTNGPPTQ